jgi:hypothetical protein
MRALDEYELIVFESYQFLRSVSGQSHRHCVQQFVREMHAGEWLECVAPFDLRQKRFQRLTLPVFQN